MNDPIESQVRLRSVRPETDFPAIVRLINHFDRVPTTLEQVEKNYYFMPEGRILRRTMAVDADDQVIGYGVMAHETWFPEGEFYVWIIIEPAWRGRGTGTHLYADALAFLRDQGAVSLKSEIHDNDDLSMRFARRYGYEIDRHIFESELDLTTFDETPYTGLISRLESEGFRFISLADLGDTTEARRGLYRVNHDAVLDIPGYVGGWFTFDQFQELVCSSHWYRPEGQFGVLDGETWAGIAAVQLLDDQKLAYNLFTGVLRPYRGRKLALALKLVAIRYALAHGMQRMRTDNDSLNDPMLAINRKLGYVPEPGKYFIRTRLS